MSGKRLFCIVGLCWYCNQVCCRSSSLYSPAPQRNLPDIQKPVHFTAPPLCICAFRQALHVGPAWIFPKLCLILEEHKYLGSSQLSPGHSIIGQGAGPRAECLAVIMIKFIWAVWRLGFRPLHAASNDSNVTTFHRIQHTVCG